MQLSLLMEAVEAIRHSSQPRLTLETAFLKIIEAGNVVPVASLLGHLEEMLKREQDNAPSPLAVNSPEPLQNRTAATKESRPSPSSAENVQPMPRREEVQSAAATMPPAEPLPSAQPATPAPERSGLPPQKSIEPHSHERDIRRDWSEFVKYVHGHKVWMAKDLQRADSAKQVDKEMHLHYTDPANCALLRQKENRQLLTEYFLDFFQKDLKIRFIIPDQQDNTEAAGTDTPQNKRQQLASDPLVIMTADIFNGQVGDIRVGQQSR